MITSIIFSKNRPLQLDLCLASIKKNFKDCSQIVVLHNNCEEYEDAHKTLEREHSDVIFWNQSNCIFEDISYIISNICNNGYVCFFTDDNIFFSEININFLNLLDDPAVSCISLRMGLNICERQIGEEIKEDTVKGYYKHESGCIFWPKTFYPYGSYWSYDLSVDGHIFKKDRMQEMIAELVYIKKIKYFKNTPNDFETALQRFWAISPNLIMSPFQSVVVNSPNNKVQDTHDENRAGDSYSFSSKYLMQKYNSGARIILESLDIKDIRCPHTEIDILKGLK